MRRDRFILRGDMDHLPEDRFQNIFSLPQRPRVVDAGYHTVKSKDNFIYGGKNETVF